MDDKTPVEAIQYDGGNGDAVVAWTGTEPQPPIPGKPNLLAFTSAEVDYGIAPSDWVVKVSDDHYVVCTDNVFSSTYRLA